MYCYGAALREQLGTALVTAGEYPLLAVCSSVRFQLAALCEGCARVQVLADKALGSCMGPAVLVQG